MYANLVIHSCHKKPFFYFLKHCTICIQEFLSMLVVKIPLNLRNNHLFQNSLRKEVALLWPHENAERQQRSAQHVVERRQSAAQRSAQRRESAAAHHASESEDNARCATNIKSLQRDFMFSEQWLLCRACAFLIIKNFYSSVHTIIPGHYRNIPCAHTRDGFGNCGRTRARDGFRRRI